MSESNPYTTPHSDADDDRPKIVYGRPPGAPDESAAWRVLFFILSWTPATILLFYSLIMGLATQGLSLAIFWTEPPMVALLAGALCCGAVGFGVILHRPWLCILGLAGVVGAGLMLVAETMV